MRQGIEQRGWVYVVSQAAIPGMIKIGFTLRPPEERARDFDRIGLPGSFVVEYEANVESPRAVERAVHAELRRRQLCKGREWFTLPVDQAISEIKRLAGDSLKSESLKRTANERAEFTRLVHEHVERQRKSGGVDKVTLLAAFAMGAVAVYAILPIWFFALLGGVGAGWVAYAFIAPVRKAQNQEMSQQMEQIGRASRTCSWCHRTFSCFAADEFVICPWCKARQPVR